jgi:protein gp37
MASVLKFTQNIAVGVTVEEAKYKWRIDFLQEIPAHTRYISFLPLLGPVGRLDLQGIRTVTIGAEEWGLHRPCKDEWIEDIKKQCEDQNVEWLSDYFMYDRQ